MEIGEFNSGCSYIRFGKGKGKLVIFPPLNDSLFSAEKFAWYYRHIYGKLGQQFDVYIISTKRHPPVGYSTRDIARDYAGIIKPLGPVNIMGISLGGMVAQHFACDYAQYVKRLILVASAHRMGPEGLIIARRWIPWARLGLWKEIYEDTIELSYRFSYRILFNLLKPFFGRYLSKSVKDPSGFIIAGQSGIMHDSFDILPQLKMPVLVIAGTQDRFFPEPLFHEMGERLPQCELLIIKGAKHGVFEENKRECLRAITAFIQPKTVHLSPSPLTLEPVPSYH